MKKREIKTLCIYCGSALSASAAFMEAACEFSRLLARRGIDIVYGAGSCGLMGAVADAALKEGGRVIGVVPRQFVKEVVHDALSEKILVNSMSERKRVMLELSDAFVALAGGYGTLDEITEALTLLQLGAIDKPCGFLNTKNYYGNFFDFLDNSVNENFVSQMHRDMALVSKDPEMLLHMLESYERPAEKLWWDEGLNGDIK